MIEVLLTAVVTGFFSTGVGFLFGRRKNKAEASVIEVDAQRKSHELTMTILDDNRKKLDMYLKRIDALELRLIKSEEEVSKMRRVISTLANVGCTVKNCPMRELYNEDGLVKLLTAAASSIVTIDEEIKQ